MKNLMESISEILMPYGAESEAKNIIDLITTHKSLEPTYQCKHPGCEVRRTKAEGGTTFTVCDYHWENRNAPHGNPPSEPKVEPLEVYIRQYFDGAEFYVNCCETTLPIKGFLSEKEAIEFCNKRGLKLCGHNVVKIINETGDA